MNIKDIEEFLKSRELDIRITGSARFIDQKCTPDVLSTIAECIQNYQGDTFCATDIWQSKFAADTVTRFFNKPETSNVKTSNEYDKFFGQPIKTLEYAGVIELVPNHSGRSHYYKIVQPLILNRIAVSDRKAFDFIIVYLNEVLRQSGILHWFEDFLRKQDKDEYATLKHSFENFIIQYTPINKVTEVRRIFTKIINPLAVEKNKAGSRRGRFSKDNIRYDELLYNRVNFRDFDKPKDMPRAVFLEQQPQLIEQATYSVDKAKRQVKRYQGTNSEIHPNLYGEANHAHHIFPQNSHLELSDTLENLVVLTATEHFEFAHIKSSTSEVGRGYQMVCLLCKIESLKKSIIVKDDDFYSIDSFINTLEIGLNTKFLFNKYYNKEAFLDAIGCSVVSYYLKNYCNTHYRIKPEDLRDVILSLSNSQDLILSDRLKYKINSTFGGRIVGDKQIGVHHTLNIVAQTAMKEINLV